MSLLENKVVSMDFDNSKFETKIRQTINTIDNFNDKLVKMSGSDKAFSSLVNTASQLTDKFSVLETVAITTLSRITNKAIDMSTALVKALSIDQISAGFDKYSTITTATSTILAAAPTKKLEDVERLVERLGWYTDETSYELTTMIDTIGKFTAAGLDLDKSAVSMMGIANWAAEAGANAQKASHSMVQLAQAMGRGYIRLDDWRSIQTMNMDTQNVRKQLILAAEELGTLKKTGDDTWETNVEGVNKLQVTMDNFANTLSQGQWLTTEAFEKAMSVYGGLSNDLYDVFTALTDESVAFQANASFTLEAYDAIKAYVDENDILIDTTSDVIDVVRKAGIEFDQYGLQLFENAQVAKTWEDVINSVKDAASTKWSNIFKAIFGNLDQAKKSFTDMANSLWDVFAGPIDRMVGIFKEWSDLGGRDLLFSDDELNPGAIYNIIDAVSALEQVLERVIQKIFGDITPERLYEYTEQFKEFTEKLVLNDKQIESWANTIVGVINTIRNGITLLQNLYSLLGTVTNGLFSSNPIQTIQNITNKFTDIINFAFTRFNKLVKAVDKAVKPIVSRIKTAWQNVFGKNILGQGKKFVDDVINKIIEFLDKLSKDEKLLNNIGDTFEGIFQILKNVKDIASNLLDIFLELFGIDTTNGIYDKAAAVAEFTAQLKDWADKVQISDEAMESIKTMIQSIADTLIEGFKSAWSFVERIKNAFFEVFPELKVDSNSIIGGITTASDHLKDLFKQMNLSEDADSAVDGINKKGEAVEDIFVGIFRIIKSIASFASQLVSIIFDSFTSAFDLNFSDTESGLETVSNLLNGFATTLESMPDITEELRYVFDNLFAIVKNLFGLIKDIYNSIGKPLVTEIFGSDEPSAILHGIGDGLGAIASVVGGGVKGISDFVSQSNLLSDAIGLVGDTASFAAGALGDFFDFFTPSNKQDLAEIEQLTEEQTQQGSGGYVGRGLGTMLPNIDDIQSPFKTAQELNKVGEDIKEELSNTPELTQQDAEKSKTFWNVIADILLSIGNAVKRIMDDVTLGKIFAGAGIFFGGKALMNLSSIFSVFKSWEKILSGAVSSIASGIGKGFQKQGTAKVLSSTADLIKSIALALLVVIGAVAAFAYMWEKHSDSMGKALLTVGGIALFLGGMAIAIFAIANHAANTKKRTTVAFKTISDWKDVLTGGLNSLTQGVSDFVQGDAVAKRIKAIGSFVLKIAIAMGLIVAAIFGAAKMFEHFEGKEDYLNKALILVGVLAGIITVMVIALLAAVKKMTMTKNKLSSLDKVVKIMDAIGKALKGVAKAFVAFAVGVALMTLATAVFKDPEKGIVVMRQAATMMTVMIAVVLGLIVAITAVALHGQDNIYKAPLVLLSVGLAMIEIGAAMFPMILAMTALIALMGIVDWLSNGRGVELFQTSFTILVGMILAMSLGLRLIEKGANSSKMPMKAAGAIMVMAISMSLIVLAIGKMINMLSSNDILSAKGGELLLDALLLFVIVIGSLSLVLGIMTDFISKDYTHALAITKVATAFLIMSAALTVIAGAIGLILISLRDVPSGTKLEFILAPMFAITVLMALMGVILNRLSQDVNPSNLYKVSTSFVIMAAALAVIGGVIFMLTELFDEAASERAVTVAFGIGLVISALALLFDRAGKYSNTIGKSVLVVLTMLGAFSLIAHAMYEIASKVDGWNVVKAAAGITLIIAAITGALWAMSKLTNTKSGASMPKANALLKATEAFAVVAGAMFAIGLVLKELAQRDPLSLGIGAACLSIICLAMAGSLKILSTIDKTPTDTLKMAGAFGIVAGSLAIVGLVLALLGTENPGALAVGGAAMILIVAAIAGAITLMTRVGKDADASIKMAGAFGIIAVSLALVGRILQELAALDAGGLLAGAGALAIIALAIGGTLILMARIGKDANTMLKAAAAFAIVVASIGAMAVLLGKAIDFVATEKLDKLGTFLGYLTAIVAIAAGSIVLVGLIAGLTKGNTVMAMIAMAGAFVILATGIALITRSLADLTNSVDADALTKVADALATLLNKLLIMFGIIAGVSLVIGVLSAIPAIGQLVSAAVIIIIALIAALTVAFLMLSKALDILASAMLKMAETFEILDRIGPRLGDIAENIKKSAPKFADAFRAIKKTIIDIISETVFAVFDLVLTLIDGLLARIEEKLPDILTSIGGILGGIMKFIGTFVEAYGNTFFEDLGTLVAKGILGLADVIEMYGGIVLQKLYNLMKDAPGIGWLLPDYFMFKTSISSAFETELDRVEEITKEAQKGTVKGFREYDSTLRSVARSIATATLDTEDNVDFLRSVRELAASIGNKDAWNLVPANADADNEWMFYESVTIDNLTDWISSILRNEETYAKFIKLQTGITDNVAEYAEKTLDKSMQQVGKNWQVAGEKLMSNAKGTTNELAGFFDALKSKLGEVLGTGDGSSTSETFLDNLLSEFGLDDGQIDIGFNVDDSGLIDTQSMLDDLTSKYGTFNMDTTIDGADSAEAVLKAKQDALWVRGQTQTVTGDTTITNTYYITGGNTQDVVREFSKIQAKQARQKENTWK